MGPCFSGSSDRLRRCLAGFLQDAACAWEVHICRGTLANFLHHQLGLHFPLEMFYPNSTIVQTHYGFVFFPFMMSRAFFFCLRHVNLDDGPFDISSIDLSPVAEVDVTAVTSVTDVT